MTEVVAQDSAPKRDKSRKTRMVADDVVTGLATHLGMTRQNVARLTAEAVIEQHSNGCCDQTSSRFRLHQAPALGASAVAAHASRS